MRAARTRSRRTAVAAAAAIPRAANRTSPPPACVSRGPDLSSSPRAAGLDKTRTCQRADLQQRSASRARRRALHARPPTAESPRHPGRRENPHHSPLPHQAQGAAAGDPPRARPAGTSSRPANHPHDLLPRPPHRRPPPTRAAGLPAARRALTPPACASTCADARRAPTRLQSSFPTPHRAARRRLHR
eukprot:2914057-Pleurochrysis_carterae.AAC.7